MYDLTLEDFTRIVVRKIQEIKNKEVVLKTPNTESLFPCTVVRTPQEIINLTDDNGVPIVKTFFISIEEWSKDKYKMMKMQDETMKKLRELNIVKKSNDFDDYDKVVQKYRIVSSYEVIYDCLFNCFKIKK